MPVHLLRVLWWCLLVGVTIGCGFVATVANAGLVTDGSDSGANTLRYWVGLGDINIVVDNSVASISLYSTLVIPTPNTVIDGSKTIISCNVSRCLEASTLNVTIKNFYFNGCAPIASCYSVAYRFTSSGRVTGCGFNHAGGAIISDALSGLVVGPSSPTFNPSESNSFLDSYITVSSLARNTMISGNYFGFLLTNVFTPYPTTHPWIEDFGRQTVIGLDYGSSSIDSADVLRNVFAPNELYMIALHSTSTSPGSVAGNWFGYDHSGGTSIASLPAPLTGIAIYHTGSADYIIGTDGNGSGDLLEHNWFGCINHAIINQQIGAGALTITGNFFGFGTVLPSGSLTPGAPPFQAGCVANRYIELVSAASSIVGTTGLVVPFSTTSNYFIGDASVFVYSVSPAPVLINGNVFGTDSIGTTGLVGASTTHVQVDSTSTTLTMSSNAVVGGDEALEIINAAVVTLTNNNIGMTGPNGDILSPNLPVTGFFFTNCPVVFISGNAICASNVAIEWTTSATPFSASIYSNIIGTTRDKVTPMTKLPNNYGVLIPSTCIPQYLDISGNRFTNQQHGIFLKTSIQTNIGLNVFGIAGDGATPFYNDYGIETVGDNILIRSNIISACLVNCILVSSASSNVTVINNRIGLNELMSNYLPTTGTGIGVTASDGVVISYNFIVGQGKGIFCDTTTTNAAITRNGLGTDASYHSVLPNTIGLHLLHSYNGTMNHNVFAYNSYGLQLDATVPLEAINDWQSNWFLQNTITSVLYSSYALIIPAPVITRATVTSGVLFIDVELFHSIGRSDSYNLDLYASSSCSSGPQGEVHIGNFFANNDGNSNTTWSVTALSGTAYDGSTVTLPNTGYCYLTALATESNAANLAVSSKASSQFSACVYYCSPSTSITPSLSTSITLSQSIISSVTSSVPTPAPTTPSPTKSKSAESCYRCLDDNRCASSPSNCDGDFNNFGKQITAATISYTGKNRNQELLIPIEQSSQVIGSIVVPARTFPNNWTLELIPAEGVDKKLRKGGKGKCGKNEGQDTQEQASPAFDLIVRDAQGRERDISNLPKPISLSMFATKLQKNNDDACFGFAKTGDNRSKFRCLDRSTTKVMNTKNSDVIYVESTTDHLTTFAVLFSSSSNGGGDLNCDTLWIVSVSLISFAFVFVLILGVSYNFSPRFRALVMGYEHELSLGQIMQKVERIQQ